MLKLVGAMLIMLTSALLGIYQATQYANRPKEIRQLIQALQRLETEIHYGLTPLPDALERLSQAISGPLSGMFQRVAEQLRKQGNSTSETWKRVMQEGWKQTSMKTAELETILQLGTTLGISDRQDQIKHIHLAVNHLQGEEANAQEEQKRYEKMWKSLGFLVGAFIVLLMI